MMKKKNKDEYEEQLKIEKMIEEGKIKEARELAAGRERELLDRKADNECEIPLKRVKQEKAGVGKNFRKANFVLESWI